MCNKDILTLSVLQSCWVEVIKQWTLKINGNIEKHEKSQADVENPG